MTRINVISVEELTDNFLMAEYYELPRMWPLIYRAIQKNDRDLPQSYRMGAGHLRFFYNKFSWLENRYAKLWFYGKKRGLQLEKDSKINIWPEDVRQILQVARLLGDDVSFWNTEYFPTTLDIQKNRNRLEYRRRYDGGSYQLSSET